MLKYVQIQFSAGMYSIIFNWTAYSSTHKNSIQQRKSYSVWQNDVANSKTELKLNIMQLKEFGKVHVLMYSLWIICYWSDIINW